MLTKIASQVDGGDKAHAIAASVSTDTVFEEHFAPIAKVSKRSFTSVFYLSIAAFVAGICLIGRSAYRDRSPHRDELDRGGQYFRRKRIDSAEKLNDAIGKAMKDALKRIPSPAEQKADASAKAGPPGANGHSSGRANGQPPPDPKKPPDPQKPAKSAASAGSP